MPAADGERSVLRGRVAWLLALHRRCAGFEPVEGFAHAVRGPKWPRGVSRSQVYRWESGHTPPSFAAVCAYEKVLDLTPGHLLGVLDVAHRCATGAVGGPVLRRPVVDDPDRRRRILDLVERADSGASMTGSDWDVLTALLSTYPHVCLRDRDMTMLAHRLIAELCRAEGQGWLRRQESLARMVGHAAAGALFVRACGEVAEDPSTAVSAEALLALDGTRHASATRLVLRHLSDPVTDDACVGALIVALQKLRLEHFRGRALRELSSTVADLADAAHLRGMASHVGIELLRSLPGAEFDRVRARLARATGADPVAARVLRVGRLAVGTGTTGYCRRLARAATALLPVEVDHDPVVTALVVDMLSSPDATRRFIAIRFLTASPYRRPLTRLLRDDLASTRLAADPVLGTLAVLALVTLGEPDDRPVVARLATAPGMHRELTHAAIRGLGHMEGDSADHVWQRLFDQQRRDWLGSAGTRAPAGLSNLVYALGMRRRHALLDRVAADPDLPPSARAAAAWWRRTGHDTQAYDT